MRRSPKYLCLYSTATFDVLDSPAYRTALANQTDWSKATIAHFKNMIRGSRASPSAAAQAAARRSASSACAPQPTGRTRCATRCTEQLDPARDRDGIISMHLIESEPACRAANDDAFGFRCRRGRLVRADRRHACQRGLGSYRRALYRCCGVQAAVVISIGIYSLMWDLAKSDIAS